MGTQAQRNNAPRISLTRNITSVHTLEELKIQIGEFVNRLEDYLNSQISIHFLEDNRRRPTLIAGDLVFDFTHHPEFATLQQWDGEKLIPLGLDTIVGTIDLIERGVGSGNDRSLFLASDGEGGWVLREPELIEFNATEAIPAFSLATANGRIADSSNLLHYNKVIGMVKVAVANGFIGEANVDGEVTNPAWAWSSGSKLFLNGTTISLTPPATGFSQMVAIARSAQTIIMNIKQAILL